MQKKRKMSASPKPGSKSVKAGEAPTRKGERKKAPSGPVTEIEKDEEEEAAEGRRSLADSSSRGDADEAPSGRRSLASSDEDLERDEDDEEGQDEDIDEGERGFSSQMREDDEEAHGGEPPHRLGGAGYNGGHRR